MTPTPVTTRSTGTLRPRRRGGEHAALTSLYEAWGYRAGIAPVDVVFVAERSGAVVGIVRRSREDGLTMLRGMYTSPSARRTRVGTSLLEAFVRDLGEEDCYCIPFAHLTAFYGRAGFTVVSEIDRTTAVGGAPAAVSAGGTRRAVDAPRRGRNDGARWLIPRRI